MKFPIEADMIVKTKGGAAMIWCVEDDASIRDIEVYALTSTGFDARGFEDGMSFWAALQTEQPELVDGNRCGRNGHPCGICGQRQHIR